MVKQSGSETVSLLASKGNKMVNGIPVAKFEGLKQTASSGVGGASGALFVIFSEKFAGVEWSATEAVTVAAALAVLISGAVHELRVRVNRQ